MRVSSAKAKGRRAARELKLALLAAAPELTPYDIRETPSSVPGEDLWMSQAARARFPYSFEVKNTEKLGIFAAIEQCCGNAKKVDGVTPAVAFRRNGHPMWVAIPLEKFIELNSKDEKTNPSNSSNPQQEPWPRLPETPSTI